MPNQESFGGMEREEFEKEDSGLEKEDVFIIDKNIVELLKGINQNQEIKERALAYANRE